METTSPNKARRVILFILKEYRTFAGMQMDQPRLSAEGPVEEINPDQEENQSQDPASVFGGNSFANLAGSDRGFGVEGSQPQRQQSGKQGQGQEPGEAGGEGGLVRGCVELVTGAHRQADRFQMDDAQQKAQAGANGQGGHGAAGTGGFADG